MKKFLVKVNGNQYEVEVEELLDNQIPQQGHVSRPEEVKISNQSSFINTPTSKSENINKPEKAVVSGGNNITAPMPGSIVRIDVKIGDTVENGQVLLILEAMKMENEITSPFSGKVLSINANMGDAVNAGDVLISIG